MSEAAEEAAPLRGRELDRQQHRAAVLAADPDALEDPEGDELNTGAQL